MRSLTLLIIACLFSFRLFAQAPNTPKLDSLFNVLSANNKVMGSVAISKNGAVVYRKAIGYSDVDAGQKANENTLYHIGSISKMFTAVMTFQLIEEKKLSLSTPLSTYFPQIPDSKKITIKLLLNHRSGLYDFINDTNDLAWVTTAQTKDAIIASIAEGKAHAQPDEKFIYCNSGYFLLAAIIENITKQSYDENLQSRICAKIGLTHTYSPADNRLKVNEAYSHQFKNNGWAKMTDLYFPNVVGVGDILSTPSDLVAFDKSLLSGKLIGETSLASMKTFVDDEGMGIMKISFGKKAGLGHSGDTFGSHSLVVYFPADALAIAVCVNGEEYPHTAIYDAVFSLCSGKDYTIPSFKTIEVSEEVLVKYTGIYSSKEIPLKVTVTHKGKTLFAQATEQSSIAMEATERDKFKYDKAGIELEFDTEKHEMVLIQGGDHFLFTRDK